MKLLLRKLFSPLLAPLERGNDPYHYTPGGRKVLLAFGILLSLLSASIVFFGRYSEGWGFVLPAVVFALVALTCLVVALLGEDRAVAKIWGSK